MSRKKVKIRKSLSPRERGGITLKMASVVSPAISFYQAGQFREAAALCRQVLEHCPEHIEAMHVLGLSLFESGKPEEGECWVRKARDHQPGSSDFHFSLGNILHAQGRLKEAIESLETVTALRPDHADAYYNLGNLYLAEKEFSLAVVYFEQAVQQNPKTVGAWHNWGVALAALGRIPEARDCYEKAIALNPKSAASFNSMGMLLKGIGDLPGALTCFKQAVDVGPDYAAAWINLGNVCLEMSDPDSAHHAFEQALRLAPDLPEAHFNRANFYQERGKPAEALAGYQKALQLKPDYLSAVAQIYYQARQACDWSLTRKWEEKLDVDTSESLRRGLKPAEMPFINLIREMDPGRNLAVASAWSHEVAKQVSVSLPFFPKRTKKTRNELITIGYLSSDFRDHPVGLLIAGMLSCHDRSRFRVHGYAYGPDDLGDTRKKILAGCDRFVNINKLSTIESARRIYEDRVDIIVDLTGHTRGNRIGICTLRPAPIQVSYLGFLGSSGADFIDYILTDQIATPPEQANLYTEKFAYLPDSFMVTDNQQPISEASCSRRDFGLPEDSFVFCSFNNPYKIDSAVFDCWVRILKQVPESILWLFTKNSLTAENLKREAAGRNVSPDRLVFAEKVPLPEHLARLKLVDLALDTWCYNGGATTANVLWAGVPVVSLMGKHFVSRMTASTLFAVGLKEMVTDSPLSYEQLAVRLATHPETLGAVRERLEKNRQTMPLFDTQRFTRHLEMAYDAMWDIYLSSERPRSIEVEDHMSAIKTKGFSSGVEVEG